MSVEGLLSGLEGVRFDAAGLVPAVIQDAQNGQVLMVGYMNREAIERTLSTGLVTYWSRSRQKFWVKGETSGNIQRLRGMYVDCDQDCLLVKVEQVGPACHEGYRSCFFREVVDQGASLQTVSERWMDPDAIYGAGKEG